MPEESRGLFHLGHKDDQPTKAPEEATPPAEAHHGLFHSGKPEEPPPPPPPPEKHGLFHLGGHEEPPPPPPPPPGLMARLFHRAPVTPEPASPQRPQLFRHHSFRSALYILGLLCLLGGIVDLLPGYRFVLISAGAALLLGGILLTGDWHPLSGMFGLRKVRVPTSASGVATAVAEHEARQALEKASQEDDGTPKASVAQRLAPWHWPWSERAREAAQEQKAEEARKFKHVGIFGKILMGVMAAVMGFGADKIVQNIPQPAGFSSFSSYAHGAIVLLTIVLILGIIITRVRTFRHHWLSPFGILRRLLIFFVIVAVVGLAVSLLTNNQALGQGYGELVGGLVGILAVLF